MTKQEAIALMRKEMERDLTKEGLNKPTIVGPNGKSYSPNQMMEEVENGTTFGEGLLNSFTRFKSGEGYSLPAGTKMINDQSN